LWALCLGSAQPTLTITQVYALAEAVHQRYRALVLLAMVYLHGSDARQHQIAKTLSSLVIDELKRGGRAAGNRSGTQRARSRKRAS
jgi:hypothetical protein